MGEDVKLINDRQSGNNTYQAPNDPQWGEHNLSSDQGNSGSDLQLNPLGNTNNIYKLDDSVDEDKMESRNK